MGANCSWVRRASSRSTFSTAPKVLRLSETGSLSPRRPPVPTPSAPFPLSVATAAVFPCAVGPRPLRRRARRTPLGVPHSANRNIITHSYRPGPTGRLDSVRCASGGPPRRRVAWAGRPSCQHLHHISQASLRPPRAGSRRAPGGSAGRVHAALPRDPAGRPSRAVAHRAPPRQVGPPPWRRAARHRRPGRRRTGHQRGAARARPRAGLPAASRPRHGAGRHARRGERHPPGAARTGSSRRGRQRWSRPAAGRRADRRLGGSQPPQPRQDRLGRVRHRAPPSERARGHEADQSAADRPGTAPGQGRNGG